MGRPAKNDHSKTIPLRFPPGLRERLDAVLRDGESRTGLIQQIIEREVAARETAAEGKP
jgi:predicted DNA-binding protein